MKEQNDFEEALNEIHVPTDKLDAILTDTFKKKTKKFTLNRWVKYSAAVAILSLGIITSASLSPVFANFMVQIPFMGHAFEYFISQEEYYEAYEDISTDIGMSAESNGVEIIIEQAFFDGNTVTFSYVLRTEEKFDTLPTFGNGPYVEGGRNNSGDEVEYIEGVGYVGMITILNWGKLKDIVEISWKPESITFDDKTINGDWNFSFTLDELEGTHIAINEQVSKDGVTVKLINAIKTDVNLTINYLQEVLPSVLDEWSAVEAELFAMDNLGNEYQVPYNGGTGPEDANTSEDLTWNATIHGLNPEATSITFYPFAHLSNIGDWIRIDFDPIIVELE